MHLISKGLEGCKVDKSGMFIGSKVIATSNIPTDDVFAKVNYYKLLNDQEYVKDNSGLMLIKLLSMLNCDITVYGMD